MQTKLDALPPCGGIVGLEPGAYGDGQDNPDGHWTQTLSLPDTDYSTYTLDFRGSDIDIDSFTGNFIESKGIGNTVNIYGPGSFDVADVDDPGDVLHLCDISSSTIHWPKCRGPVDAIIRKRAQQISGHMNRICVSGTGMQRGIIIGDEDDPQTSDRSFWWGQLNQIEDVGVHVAKGQSNHLFVQAEGDKQGHEATGYRIDWGQNFVYNNHSKTTTPFDIRAQTFFPTMPGRAAWSGSRLATPPNMTAAVHGETTAHWDHFVTDTVSQYDTTGDVAVNRWGDLRIRGDGQPASCATAGRVTTPHRNTLVSASITRDTDSDATVRFGFYESEQNHAMLVADPVANTTWHAVVVVDGVEQANVDTGVSLSVSRRELTAQQEADAQRFGIMTERVDANGYPKYAYTVADTDVDISSITTPRIRVDITPADTSSQEKVHLREWAWVGL
ncbi:hypothetical protein [Halopelagius fulvigenes]|uniref:Uncharacterized protein n=1 Tax=Halopelagius fulvigenes TaxID=1198324 RepID=A0ABD5U3K8_9EURY